MSLPLYTRIPWTDPSSFQKTQPLAADNDDQEVSFRDHAQNASEAVYPPAATASAAASAVAPFALPSHLVHVTLCGEAFLWQTKKAIGTRGLTKPVSHPFLLGSSSSPHDLLSPSNTPPSPLDAFSMTFCWLTYPLELTGLLQPPCTTYGDCHSL